MIDSKNPEGLALPENAPAVTLFGVPWDAGSSYLRGSAAGPAALRRALYCKASNLGAELGHDLGADATFADAGDVPIADVDASETVNRIQTAAAAVFASGSRPLAVGGDHAVTFPLVAAAAKAHPGLTVLHFDAHPDLYNDFGGDPLSHASPFARIMERGLASRLVQVGIRSLPPALRSQAKRFGVEMIEMHHLYGNGWARALKTAASLPGPLYISFDLDALDPAFAPGVSHHEPGGLSTRQALELLHAVTAPVVAADVVELNPLRDWQDMTAAAGAKFVKELTGLMVSNLED